MAATGYTPISLYYSSTTTNVPLAANLAAGELALNTADGKLFYKTSGGVVAVLATAANATSPLAILNGGTGQTTANAAFNALSPMTTAGDVIYGGTSGVGTRLAVGTAGQVLTVNSGATAPQWSTPTTGTVTSVSWTGGLVSVATSTTTPAFTVAGTSGGIPYFSSATTWATSAALAANAIVLGGGAGTAPATTTTGTGVVTAINNAVNTGSGLVTQSGTLAASALLLGGGSATAISSTTTGTGVVTALSNAVNATGGLTTIDGTATLTNKRVTPRVLASTANSATPTLNTDSYDMMVITAQSAAITSFTTNLTGTPTNGQKLWISITGTAAVAITWGAKFESSTVTLPSTTVTTARLDVGFVWNVATTTWRCVATA